MTSTAVKLLLNVLSGGGGSPITYLFRDEFTTDEAAPIASPRTAEPGPGTWTIVDPSNGVSVVSGELVMIGNGGWNTVIYGSGITRAAGRTLFVQRKINTSAAAESGFSATSPPTGNRVSPHLITAQADLRADGVIVSPSALTNATYYEFAIVLRGAGAFSFCKGGGQYTNWTLIWVNVANNDATVYPALTIFHAAQPVAYPYSRIFDLSAPFVTDYGIATLNVASPANATEYAGDANAVIDMTVTAPGSLDGSAATRCGFYYRADSDLSPSWHCYVDGTGAFNLDSIDAAGTRTNQITAASVITGGATRTLRVICDGSVHNAFTLSGTTWTKRGSEITLSLNDAVTTIEPVIPAGWSAANLRCYPRTSSAYDALNRGN